VLLSDDLDEIDWETTGTGENHIQTNYYGKGFLNYNVGRYVNVTSPQTSFHTYALDWTADTLIWSIDQVVVRTLKASEAGNYFPQTPMKVSLSLWDGGDPSEPVGTKNWAGGETTLPPPKPYTMYIKSVKITNATPAQQYQYTDKSGSWKSIRVVDEPFNSSTSSVSNSQSVVASIPLGPTGTAIIPTIQSGSSISLSGTPSGIVGIAPSSRASVAISPTSAATNTPMTPVVFSKSTSATAESVTAPAVVSLASNIAPLSTPALPTGASGSTHEILITQM
jgi:beta-glucanase (GH16 family)